MKINWGIRFKNKTFLTTFILAIVAFVYQILAMFDIVPAVGEDSIINIATIIINILCTLGIVIDPTTSGAGDSDRALTYGTDEDIRLKE